ncbi:MAG: carbohydrate kinase family protein [Anaerolineales bacterium]|nr:carbohydrate kinase family protein [Anaerolineales bacterium]
MAKILVSGLINVETTLRIDRFPIEYQPQQFPFFGIRTSVSGVGYNVATALHALGNEVALLSLIGSDLNGLQVQSEIARIGLAGDNVLAQLEQTPQSVILYEPGARRECFTDLKDIQEQRYPEDRFQQLAVGASAFVGCNANISRPLLFAAKAAGLLVATDIHTIANLDDDFNRDFMALANILFMSNERLPLSPEDWAQAVINRYNTPIVVIGLGHEGALLAVRDDRFVGRLPAVRTRAIVNTVGAGDALFSCFVHTYLRTHDPYRSLQTAIVFASWKIGGNGGADGLLSQEELVQLAGQAELSLPYARVSPN